MTIAVDLAHKAAKQTNKNYSAQLRKNDNLMDKHMGRSTVFHKHNFLLLHLRNLLTHTLLFWHFLKNLNFEFRNTLEYIRTMFSGNARSFSERSDSELLKYGSLS